MRICGQEPGELHELMNLVRHLKKGRPMHARQYVLRPSSETSGQATFSKVSSTASAQDAENGENQYASIR